MSASVTYPNDQNIKKEVTKRVHVAVAFSKLIRLAAGPPLLLDRLTGALQIGGLSTVSHDVYYRGVRNRNRRVSDL